MALFGKDKEDKAEKQAKKEQELLAKYGLENLSDPIDVETIRKIANELTGTGLMSAGTKISFASKPEDLLQICYQRALVEQNFIMIRQLDRIEKLLQK